MTEALPMSEPIIECTQRLDSALDALRHALRE
jgi:hypothetical protein